MLSMICLEKTSFKTEEIVKQIALYYPLQTKHVLYMYFLLISDKDIDFLHWLLPNIMYFACVRNK